MNTLNTATRLAPEVLLLQPATIFICRQWLSSSRRSVKCLSSIITFRSGRVVIFGENSFWIRQPEKKFFNFCEGGESTSNLIFFLQATCKADVSYFIEESLCSLKKNTPISTPAKRFFSVYNFFSMFTNRTSLVV